MMFTTPGHWRASTIAFAVVLFSCLFWNVENGTRLSAYISPQDFMESFGGASSAAQDGGASSQESAPLPIPTLNGPAPQAPSAPSNPAAPAEPSGYQAPSGGEGAHRTTARSSARSSFAPQSGTVPETQLPPSSPTIPDPNPALTSASSASVEQPTNGAAAFSSASFRGVAPKKTNVPPSAGADTAASTPPDETASTDDDVVTLGAPASSSAASRTSSASSIPPRRVPSSKILVKSGASEAILFLGTLFLALLLAARLKQRGFRKNSP